MSIEIGNLQAAIPYGPSEKKVPMNLQKQAEDFEAVFISKMVNTMFESVEKGDFTDTNAESVFQGMMGEQIGSGIASRGGLGLAPSVLAQLIRLQGASGD